MGKFETKNIIFNEPAVTLVQRLVAHTGTSDRFTVQEVNRDFGFAVYIKAKSGRNFGGEHIIVCIEENDNGETSVIIKSELVSNTQITDWGMNKKNIGQIEAALYDSELGKKSSISQKTSKKSFSLADARYSFLEKQRSKGKLITEASCICYGGHENIKKEESGFVQVYSNVLEFRILKTRFSIPIESITSSEIITHEQLTQRLTITRMVLFGVFSLAMPKSKKNIANYLSVQYSEHGIQSTLVFRGDATASTANNLIVKLNSAILKARKEKALQGEIFSDIL